MGRLMGFEPMHIGTTIRGLNRLTTGAMFPTSSSIPNKDYKARGRTLLFRPLRNYFSLILVYSLKHVPNTTSS